MAASASIKFSSLISLLVLVHAFKSQMALAHFVLEYEIVSITTHVTNCGEDESTPECETYLSDFCLREGRNTQSNDTSDCPLGFGNTVDQYPTTREIVSQQPWTLDFQLLVRAKDFDDNDDDDVVDDVFINMMLDVNTSYTALEQYTGELGRVTLLARFRVTCQREYYGRNCSIICIAQNDDTFGHFTCNQDGTIQCLEGFQNPQNNCTESETILSSFSNLNLILGVLLGVSVLLNISLVTVMAVYIKRCREHRVNEASQSVQIKTQSEIVYTQPNTAYGIGMKAGRAINKSTNHGHRDNHVPCYSN